MAKQQDIDEDDDEAVETDAKADEPADDDAAQAADAGAEDADDDADEPADADANRRQGLESGIAAERKKRQRERERNDALQRQLDAVTAQLSAIQSGGAAAKKEELPEFEVSDMTGSAARIADAKLTAAERAKWERREAEWKAVVSSCMDDARENHPDDDVDEIVSEFVKLQQADATGRLSLRVRRAEDPVEFAIKYMEKHRARNGGGAVVDELKQKIAELEAKIGGKAPPPKKPPRIAGGRSAIAQGGRDSGDALHGAFGR